jgi:hypothetical protein
MRPIEGHGRIGSCRAVAQCERLGENHPMAVGIAAANTR